MRMLIAVMFLVVGASAVLVAGTPQAPEIDPTTAAAAVALLGGAALVIRGRRRK